MKRAESVVEEIDFDTAMPGLAPCDFGDLVCTSPTSSTENEKDLSGVLFFPDVFKDLVKGYVLSATESLTQTEYDYMVFGGRLMTFER